VPTLETPMSPGGSQASAGEGLSPCNIGIGIGNQLEPLFCPGFVEGVFVWVPATADNNNLTSALECFSAGRRGIPYI